MSTLHAFGFSITPPAAPKPATSGSRPRRQSSASSWSANYGSVYDAASRADFSGYLYIPDLNPAASLRRSPLRVIRERSWWIFGNVPPARMVITNMAEEEVGCGHWPSWESESSEFNDAMTDIWHWQNHDARFFSADQHDDAYSFQVTVRMCIRLWGDCFIQLLRPKPGATRPSVNIIPGYRVDNFGDEKPGDGWTDGFLLDRLGAPLAYKVITVAPDGTRSFEVVPADDMIFCHDKLLPGSIRGEPALACVAKRMFRREDILEAVANGTLSRELQGWAIETEQGASQDFVTPAAGGEVVQEDAEGDDEEKITVAKLFGRARGDVQIPQLPPGKKISTIESNRPGTNVREFCDEILREVAWAVGYPADYIFFIAGLSQGTAVRTVLKQVQNKLNSVRQYQVVPLLHRYSVFDCYQRIKAGVFETLGVPVPKDWWKFQVVQPEDISVDPGYVGTLMNERASTGLMSIDRFHQQGGTTTTAVDKANQAIWKRRMEWLAAFNKEHNTSFTYWDFWPRTTSAPAPSADNTGSSSEPPATK